jgi:phage tail-like protein
LRRAILHQPASKWIAKTRCPEIHSWNSGQIQQNVYNKGKFYRAFWIGAMTMMNNAVQVDSLIANEFELQIGGVGVGGIFGVRNLVTYATDAAGNRIKPPFEVTKMVQRDGNNVFNQWLRETLAARASTDKPRRDVTVVAVDDGVVTRTWTAKNAWITRVSYSDFDSSSFEMIAETIVISYDDIEEAWPATT